MREHEPENDKLKNALDSFEARTANVLIDGLTTGVLIRYSYGPDAMEIRGLPGLPPLLRFDPSGKVSALLRGELHQLPTEAAVAFNIYRLLDPRIVERGLKFPSRYEDSNYSFIADLDIGMTQKMSEFTIEDKLGDWLKNQKFPQSIEFVVESATLLRMTLFELPPARQTLSVVFHGQDLIV